MNKKRVKVECRSLQQFCDSVDKDLRNKVVKLNGFPFPDGWNRQTATIMYQLPSSYPNAPPRVFIPSNMRYRGGRPRIMLRRLKPGWSEHCIHRDYLKEYWVPQRHTLVTVSRMIKDSFRRPNSKNPWK